MFHFIKEHENENISVDICIEDNDYKELARHADLVWIASIITEYLIAPAVVSLISDYIIRTFGSRAEKATIISKLTVVVEGDKKSIEFSYDGPAQEYKDVMQSAIAKIGSTPYPNIGQLSIIDEPKKDLPKQLRTRKKKKVKR